MTTDSTLVGALIRKPPPRELNDKEKEYREKIRKANDWRSKVLEGGTKSVKNWMHRQLTMEQVGEKWVPRKNQFEYTAENMPVLAMLAMWAAGDPEFENPPQHLAGIVQNPRLEKGIYIYGMPGRGKSTMCHLIADLLSFKMVSADQVVTEFDEMMVGKGAKRPLQKWTLGNWHIDDMGTERRARFARSEDKRIMAEIIEARYRNMQRQINPGRLIVSSNIKPDKRREDDSHCLEAFYGSRVHSRMKEMCNMIVLSGPDYRDR